MNTIQAAIAEIVAEAIDAERERIARAIERHLSNYDDVMTSNERAGLRRAASIARADRVEAGLTP